MSPSHLSSNLTHHIVYEKINFITLLLLFLNKKEAGYFSISRFGRLIVNLCNKASQIQHIKYHVGDIKNDKGELVVFKIYEDLLSICDLIEKDRLNNDFINSFKPGDSEKVKIFLLKNAHKQIEREVILINVLENFVRRSHLDQLTFNITSNPYYEYLSAYALKKNISLKEPPLDFLKYFYAGVQILGYSLFFPIVEFFKTITNRRKPRFGRNIPLISTFYNLNDITTDKDKRSALFLFLNSNIKNQLLIYFERKDVPCTNKMATRMDELGIQYIAMNKKATKSKRVPIWTATRLFYKILFRENKKLLICTVKSIFRFNIKELHYLPDLCKFNGVYAYHYDFYATLNIKSNVNMITFLASNIPRNIALKDCGGLSVCYQLSNFSKPNINFGCTVDVYFSFGSYYKDILLNSKSYIETLVYCGYITDYSFEAVKHKSSSLRQILINNDVKFVVAFFDEGFGDRESCIVSKKEAGYVHDFLAKLVLNNPDIGIIHKPKRTTFSSVSTLLNEAIKTNRYLLVKEGKYESTAYPAEVAQAADVALGVLYGGTTVLESILSGVLSFYLDLENSYSFDEYSCDQRAAYIFNSLDTLKKGIYKLKRDKNSFKYPSNFMKLLKDKDPFQDGLAVTRTGDYLNWIMETFNHGASREEALSYASKNYAEKWGRHHINTFK